MTLFGNMCNKMALQVNIKYNVGAFILSGINFTKKCSVEITEALEQCRELCSNIFIHLLSFFPSEHESFNCPLHLEFANRCPHFKISFYVLLH